MKLSIIVPVYNTAPYLKQCLDSLFDQGLANHEYEIICIVEPCTDGSAEIIRLYAQNKSMIKIITNQSRMGQAYNRNVGLKIAQGSYIYFMDSDDYLEPNSLRKLFDEAEKYKTEVLFFNCKIIRDETYFGGIPPTVLYNARTDVCSGLELLANFMGQGNSITRSACLQLSTRRFLIDNNILFHEGIVHEDIPFLFNCFINAKRVKYIPKFFYNYRKRCNSTTTNININNCKSFVNIWEDMINYCYTVNPPNLAYNAITTYIDNALLLFSSYQDIIEDEFMCHYDNLIDNYLYKVLTIYAQSIKYRQFSCEPKVLYEMKRLKGIWIYGAGKIAKCAIPWLVQKGIQIKGVLVSEEIGQEIYGWNAIIFDNNSIPKEDMIVVAIKGRPGEEIKDTLLKYGFTKTIWLCEYL